MKAWETLIVWLFVSSLFGIIGGFCWPYTLNTWLVYAGKEPTLGWWHGFGMGYVPVLGWLSLPAAIITWVAQMFLA